jgi:NTP pyrophosphatase (non-canonical NTP hydrolase)
MSDKTSNIDRLRNMVSFDPTKQPKCSTDLFQEIVGEIQKERNEKAREKASGLLRRALEVAEGMAKLDREYNANKAKFDKELGKLLNQLGQQGGQAGQQVEVVEKEDADE